MSFNLKLYDDEIGTIVLLHGYGANAENLRFLANEWQHYFKQWNYLGIDGPTALTIGGYSWFDLGGENWLNDIQTSAQYITSQLQDYRKKLIFAGFSQGAFLSAHLGAYSDLNIDGCICFSGGLIPTQKPARQTPLYFIHGSEDEIILPEWFEQTLEFGNERDLPITGTMIQGMDHDINEEALAQATIKLNEWIKNDALIQ